MEVGAEGVGKRKRNSRTAAGAKPLRRGLSMAGGEVAGRDGHPQATAVPRVTRPQWPP